jgi:Tfp pilus assembly protein FimT
MADGVRGWGVVEVLVALTVAAVLVVVGLPPLQRYLALRDLEHAARGLGADLRLTQQYAVTQHEAFRLASTPSGYAIIRASDGTVVKQVDIPATVTVTSTFVADTAEFAATGSPASAGSFCLTDGTNARKVEVLPATGSVSVQEVPSCP